MAERWDIVARDLHQIFEKFPLECLKNLRSQRQRLVRRTYRTDDGKGCIMNLLAECLPEDRRIDSRKKLTWFFASPETPPAQKSLDPEYQPARWIVRLWDGDLSEAVRERYGDVTNLPEGFLMQVLDEAIAARRAAEAEEERVRVAAEVRRQSLVQMGRSG